VVRPPGELGAKALNNEELIKVKSLFDPGVKIELISDFRKESIKPYHRDLEKAIIELLSRRPARREEMAASLGVHLNEVVKSLHDLEQKKIIHRKENRERNEVYFVIAGSG
jgi:transcription initiation factor IIE alpha subunit